MSDGWAYEVQAMRCGMTPEELAARILTFHEQRLELGLTPEQYAAAQLGITVDQFEERLARFIVRETN